MVDSTLPAGIASLHMLPEIRIASPCTVDWDHMTGDNRVRHCDQCNLNVYNFAAMTFSEVEQLLAASQGQRVCGRLYRRNDGTILTRDCPVGFRTRVKRVSHRIGVALSAAMSVGLATAQTPRQQPGSSLVQIERADSGIDLTVLDPSGAVIPTAEVSVKSRLGDVAHGTTDQSGKLTVNGLMAGPYEVSAAAPGFESGVASVEVPAHQMEPVAVTLTLELSANMGVIAIVDQAYIPSERPIVDQLLPELLPYVAPVVRENAMRRPTFLGRFFSSLGHKLGF